MCFAPTGCKQGVWRRPNRDGDGAAEPVCPGDVKWEATSQCLQGDFFQENGMAVIRKPQS